MPFTNGTAMPWALEELFPTATHSRVEAHAASLSCSASPVAMAGIASAATSTAAIGKARRHRGRTCSFTCRADITIAAVPITARTGRTNRDLASPSIMTHNFFCHKTCQVAPAPASVGSTPQGCSIPSAGPRLTVLA